MHFEDRAIKKCAPQAVAGLGPRRPRRGSKSVSIIIAMLLVGIVIGATGHHLVAAPPSFTETMLLRTDLAGIDGYELIVSRLETAPGWSHGRHYHAGHEIVYVLEGTGELESQGKPPQSLRPGTVSYVPSGQIHSGRNTSPKEAFKFLLLRIHAKGQPISVELN
jgi:quercetin dioxygenase-like cupin family protein